jgi:NAD(P)-dependent dehydrogenase (short-subunit alcohol dehydrogenase family)
MKDSSDGPLGTVVITGTSSGIGRAAAVALTDAGYHVFAGVRTEQAGKALLAKARGPLTPLILDVTDSDSVSAAAKEVARAAGDRGLAGLVNNAGIGISWPMEHVPREELRRQYDVNVFGQVDVIQAFLPLLRAAAGRIVNIGSIADRLSLPFCGPLFSSKWAFASITETLRLELRPWGIHVVLVEPASIHTEAVEKFQRDSAQVLSRFHKTAMEHYGDAYRTVTQQAVAREKAGSDPGVVADTILKALTSRRPKTRYLVGKDSKPLAMLARWAPDRAFDRLRMQMFRLPTEFGALRTAGRGD